MHRSTKTRTRSSNESSRRFEFRGASSEFCAQIITLEHDVVVDDAVLHVVEKFTPSSVLRFPRRAILMLPGTLATGEMYDIDTGDGSDFSALDRAAQQGYFAFAVTYEGYPGSSLPDDGASVTAERSLDQMAYIVEAIRWSRGVAKVDLMGASFGSSLSVALGGSNSPIPPWHVGRLVLQAHVYKEVTPLFEDAFFSPEVMALLESAPGGYVPTAPEFYAFILANTDPVAAQWGFDNFPDVYATGPTLEGFDLPLFDAAHGLAPALQFWGDADLITPLSDVETFQGEYGGPNELRVLPGAGHAPYLAEPDLREAFWTETFDYLDYTPSIYFACEPE